MDTKAAFEKYCDLKRIPTYKTSNGDYSFQETIDAWNAWQASRAVIEIEFPNLSDDKFCWSDGVFNLKEDISNKLTSHGLTIKK